MIDRQILLDDELGACRIIRIEQRDAERDIAARVVANHADDFGSADLEQINRVARNAFESGVSQRRLNAGAIDAARQRQAERPACIDWAPSAPGLCVDIEEHAERPGPCPSPSGTKDETRPIGLVPVGSGVVFGGTSSKCAPKSETSSPINSSRGRNRLTAPLPWPSLPSLGTTVTSIVGVSSSTLMVSVPSAMSPSLSVTR